MKIWAGAMSEAAWAGLLRKPGECGIFNRGLNYGIA